jgi:hypothetical protein
LLKQSRDIVVARSASFQQTLHRYHARRVHPRAFQVGDLVLRRMYIKKGKHKLTLLWEVSYFVVEVIRPRVYRLQEINDTTFPNVWNIKKLRKFYPSLLSFTFFPFLLFLSSGARRTTGYARGRRSAQGQSFVLRAPWCHSRGGKATCLCRMQ